MLPVQTIISLIILVASLVFWLTTFVILYHLTRFGIGVLPKKVAVVFLVGGVIIFSTSVVLYTETDFTIFLT